MSQAENLLLEMSADIPVHTHPVVDSDTHYVIDPITRQLSSPNSGKTVIMQFDHYSEQFTFEIPRYIEGHDMMQCNSVRVHFINIHSEFEQNAGLSYVDGLAINPDDPSTVICTWLIPRDATQLAGPLNFLVQYACIDANGNLTYEWHSDINTDNMVRAGMNNSEDVADVYADVLEQWRANLFGAGDSVLAEIVAAEEASVAAVQEAKNAMLNEIALKGQETLETIPEDYATTYNLAKEGARSKANAILLESEGESIYVDDSEDAYVRNLRVFGKTTQDIPTGKNLFNYGYNETAMEVSGVTIEHDRDGYVILSGTYTGSSVYPLILGTSELDVSGEYCLSVEIPMPDTGSGANELVFVETQNIISITPDGVSKKFVSVDQAAAGPCTCGIYLYPNTTYYEFTFRAQLELGSTATDFELYTGGKLAPNPDCPVDFDHLKNPAISIYGKNLLNITTSGSAIDITETVSDGLVSFSGTATGSGGRTAWERSNVVVLTPGTYVLSMNVPSGTAPQPCLSNVDTGKVVMSAYDNTFTENTSIKFTIDETVGVYLGFNYIKDTSYDAKDVSVQLEVGTEATDYEPYKPVQTIALDQSVLGLPVTTGGNYTDSNGQQWLCDEIDFERGVYVHRVYQETVAFTPEEDTNGVRYRAWLTYHTDPIHNGFVMCDKLVFNEHANPGTNGIRTSVYSTDLVIAYYDDLVLDSANVLYPLKTPLETSLAASDIAAFEALRTHHTNTTVVNDSGAYMVLEYNGDIKKYIDKLPSSLTNGVVLADRVTGKKYVVYISDGKLTMDESGD